MSKSANSNRAEHLIALGYRARKEHRLDEALACYRQAAELFRELDSPLRLAHTIRHVADILRNQSLWQEAQPHYEEALVIYRTHANTSPLDLANTLRGFALTKENLNQPAEALALWRESHSLYAQANVEPGVEESTGRIANLLSNA